MQKYHEKMIWAKKLLFLHYSRMILENFNVQCGLYLPPHHLVDDAGIALDNLHHLGGDIHTSSLSYAIIKIVLKVIISIR